MLDPFIPQHSPHATIPYCPLGEPDEELDEQAIAPMSVDEENSEGDVTETPANEEISEQTETTEEEPIQE